MADNVDHTHGDTGSKPPQNLNFQDGGLPDPQHFDWFWSQVPAAINNHASLIESIDSDEDGVVDKADVAENATSYKNNDIDSDGDGKVDSADVADSAKTYKNNDIDSDGDGRVDSADAADTASGLSGVQHNELSDAPASAHHSKTTSASELTDVSADTDSDAHHSRYTDTEARSAVDGANVDISGDADTVDNQDASDLAPSAGSYTTGVGSSGTNTTGSPIFLTVAADAGLTIKVDGITVFDSPFGTSDTERCEASVIVPAGSSWTIDVSGDVHSASYIPIQ